MVVSLNILKYKMRALAVLFTPSFFISPVHSLFESSDTTYSIHLINNGSTSTTDCLQAHTIAWLLTEGTIGSISVFHSTTQSSGIPTSTNSPSSSSITASSSVTSSPVTPLLLHQLLPPSYTPIKFFAPRYLWDCWPVPMGSAPCSASTPEPFLGFSNLGTSITGHVNQQRQVLSAATQPRQPQLSLHGHCY